MPGITVHAAIPPTFTRVSRNPSVEENPVASKKAIEGVPGRNQVTPRINAKQEEWMRAE